MSTRNNPTPISPDEFHLGITMAGAVSAGCYTGGVMDYLFEILDLWEQAKNKNLDDLKDHYHKIPQHKVIIDAMGGASAGGMTTSMAAVYALNGTINPVRDSQQVGGIRNNIFYDSWVLLDDDGKRKTFDKVWDLDDLKSGKVTSILNTAFVDNIANKAFSSPGSMATNVSQLPSYISKDLDMLLSHCMLRGVPLEVDFTTPIGQQRSSMNAPTHSTFDHLTISYYKLNQGMKPNDGNLALWLNPYDAPYVDTLRLATKATGAFPLGLRFREFTQKEFTDAYLKSMAERIVFRNFGETGDSDRYKLSWKNFPPNFNFVAVDGGTVNNEPFGEVLAILKSRYGDAADHTHKPYGLIMIDPFPDFFERQPPYKAPDDLISMIPALVRTLTEQSKVKRAELLEAYSNSYLRGVIFPMKWNKKDDKQQFPIACESVEAFGGFLDINFRHHDFFLGRDNARNFFRFFFTLEYDWEKGNVHPIHQNWTEDMVQLFSMKRDGKTYLPIIPDLHLMRERLAGREPNPFEYTVKNRPVFNPQSLFDLRTKMEERVERILELSENKITEPKPKANSTRTDHLMSQYYPRGWWDKLKGKIMRVGIGWVFNLTKGGLARSITEAALKWILKDLEEKELL
jgi:hypothetical protein